MIELRQYQKEAVNHLSQNLYKLLKKPGARHKMILKAPTGSGKTLMMASFLSRVSEELPERIELENRELAIIWVSPNKLYLQSYTAMQQFFAETRVLKPVFFEDITASRLLPNEIMFVNWESINKEKNIMVRENESGKTLYNYVDQARLKGIEVVVVIDEEHMFANPRTAKRANEVLQRIYPKVEIRVSATPSTQCDYITLVERQEVIAEEMIKEGIILNPALDLEIQEEGKTADHLLIDVAIKRRSNLSEAYKSLGKKINPLMLIQLPNDSREETTLDDKKYIEMVLQYLEVYYDITVKNNKLAVWLSGRKENLDGIEEIDNMVEVLLFKQAIALGWDCPRAAVLLIFRDLQSTTFTIQTVGRILRMPEQQHYPLSQLNQGYVYTNLSRSMIEVVQDDMNYITMNRATRIAEYQPVYLNSHYANTISKKNNLGSGFKKSLYYIAEKFWGINRELGHEHFAEVNKRILCGRLIEPEVERIEIVLPENVVLTGDRQVVTSISSVRFAKTQDELNRVFRQFVRDNVSPFAPVDSTPVLEMTLICLFEDYFLIGQYDAIKIMVFDQNMPPFIELIEKSKEHYDLELKKKARMKSKKIETARWEIPEERIYNENYSEVHARSHVLIPYYESLKASSPEKAFRSFLELHSGAIEWWYKNGDSGKEHFAVPYTNHYDETRLFYVDFVVKFKNGPLGLFDTKTRRSDPEAPAKHNALVAFIEKENANNSRRKLIGGVVIPDKIGDNVHWRYCRNRIEDTSVLTGWEFLNPKEVI